MKNKKGKSWNNTPESHLHEHFEPQPNLEEFISNEVRIEDIYYLQLQKGEITLLEFLEKYKNYIDGTLS